MGGALPKEAIKTLPFRLYETQWGVFDAVTGVFVPLPVTGYMADTRFREKALKLSNRLNRRLFSAPLRIAVHPGDLDLPLAGDLKRHLAEARRFLSYRDLEA